MGKTEMQNIPFHRMDTEIPDGIGFSYIEVGDNYDGITKSYKNTAHRDDYYLFLFMEYTEAEMILDFEEFSFNGSCVLYVHPGQVHFVKSIKNSKGWFLAIDSMLIEEKHSYAFEKQLLTQKPISVDASVMAIMGDTARLLHSVIHAEPTMFSDEIIVDIANVFIGMIAEQYEEQDLNLQQHNSRIKWITFQFKELLSENFKTYKSPIQYAEMLNYSLPHLNKLMKKATGFPVSYWIHQRVMLEAKRLLYYTDMDVKEIAFSLGYEDHTYFSRLFSHVVGQSPRAFRDKYHE